MKKITLIVPDSVVCTHGGEGSAEVRVAIDEDIVWAMLSKRAGDDDQYHFPERDHVQVLIEHLGVAAGDGRRSKLARSRRRRAVREPPPSFGYVRAKAAYFLDVGADAYRVDDALGLPAATLTNKELELVAGGMDLLAGGWGWSRDNALDALGIHGFQLVLQTLHFELVEQTTVEDPEGESPLGPSILVQMRMRHVVTGAEAVLYNRVWADR